MTRALGVAYVTPHCQAGGHENSKVLSVGGALMPACRGTYTYRFVEIKCGCWCHEMFASLMVDSEAALGTVGDSTTTVDSPASVDPVALEHVTTGSHRGGPASVSERRNDFWKSAILDADVEPQLWMFVNKNLFNDEFNRVEHPANEGSRRKRGSLDTNVEIVCKLWLEQKIMFEHLTPQLIGMMIDAGDSPSPGAIYAVLTRWKDSGLCEVETKPFRFTGFTPAVGENGIAYAKNSVERERKARTQGFF